MILLLWIPLEDSVHLVDHLSILKAELELDTSRSILILCAILIVYQIVGGASLAGHDSLQQNTLRLGEA